MFFRKPSTITKPTDFESKQPEKNKFYITHVQQQHLPPFCLKVHPMAKEEVAYSQFQVAKTILTNLDAIVLEESLYQDYTPEFAKSQQLEPISMFSVAKMIFPSGIPKSFSELNPLQKEFLAKKSGASVLYYLGKLTHIYKTSTEEECKLVDAAVARGDMDVMFEPREKQAIHWAKQASLQSGKNNILLIFGKNHDFAKRIELLKDPSVILHEKIDTTVGGPTDLSSISSHTPRFYLARG